jgi:hypothetical protein
MNIPVNFTDHAGFINWLVRHWQSADALDQASQALAVFQRQRNLLTGADQVEYETAVKIWPWRLTEAPEKLPGIALLRWLDTPEQARTVCEWQQKEGGPLRLSVDALSPEIARELAIYPGDLELPGLQRLSPPTAAALAERPAGRLRIALGLDAAAIADFAALEPLWSRRDANISLPAMIEIDDEAAEVLGRIQGTLALPNLKRLGTRQAERLVQGDLVRLELDGLEDAALDEVLAVALCAGESNRSINEISLGGLTHKAQGLTRLVARPQGWGALQLDGLKQLPKSLAQALKQSRVRRLKLNGLTKLDLATAQALCGDKRPFHLSLNGLTRLEDSVVAVLANNDLRSLEILNADGLSEIAKQLLREFGNFDCPAVGN